jgi:predicted flavoprotein YhiN
MSLEDLVHRVESRLLRLGRMFCPVDPLSALYDALDRNEVQLRKRRADLDVAEAERVSLQTRLDNRRAAADLLTAQIEASWASGHSDRTWRLALELDRMRQEIAEDEKRLPSLSQLTWSLGFAVRQLERERARLENRRTA